jgi:hypothetical protein
MRTSSRLAASLTALSVPAVLAMSCSTSSPGSPTGGSDSSSTPASSAKPSSTRPRSIDLKSLDPCKILTPQQRQQLGFENDGAPSTAPAVLGNGKTCNFSDFTHSLSGGLTLVTIKGIDGYSDGTFGGQTQPTQVSGYPALVVKTPGLASSCSVDVDVTEGQFLDANFLAPDGDGSKQPLLCQKAQQLAEAAVGSLVRS